jgi:hypothetical protein
MLTPTASLVVKGGAQAQALTSSYAQLTAFSTNNAAGLSGAGQYGANTDSDASITPDITNNRLILNAPGVYFIDLTLSGIQSAGDTLTVECLLDGVAIPESIMVQPAVTGGFNLGTSFILNVPRLAPAGSSQRMLTINAKVAGSTNLTVQQCNFIAQRIA